MDTAPEVKSTDAQDQQADLQTAFQDPILRLAVSLYHGKGAYALLLGSGVSRSAGIPTGWEIVLDLVRQLAAAYGKQCGEGDEVAWYLDNFGAEPTYDALLDRVTGFKAERARLLGDYIEPADQDALGGTKVPQEAHHAIARLVRAGYIRVIITTNFDQLLEEALRAANVTPRVVATAEAVEQALPLVHQQCTIVKVHGDYTSGELKNTTQELAEYDERLNCLLERVFSEFGLIICGWSAEWDRGLRAVLSDAASRAYSTFWAARGELRDEAKDVISRRHGKAVIQIDSADSFFQTLEEKVDAIRRVLESPTLTAEVARATLERYLEDPYAHRIRIRNLIMAEIDRVLAWLDNHVYLTASPPPPGQFAAEVSELVTILQPTLAMFVACARWGEREQRETLREALERVLDASNGRDFSLRWVGYWTYAAYLLLYAGGVAAVSAERYETLHDLLTELTAEYFEAGQRVPMIWSLSEQSYRPLGDQIRRIRLEPKELTPLSDQLHDHLRQPLSSLVPNAARYEEFFDRFEYWLALTYKDIDVRQGDDKDWVPAGRFYWRYGYGSDRSVMVDIEREAGAQQGAWSLLRAGFFGGDFDRFNAVRTRVNGFITREQQANLM
jgi:SIR2-like domain